MKLLADRLFLSYGKQSVIEDLTLKIDKGEIVSIIGANGSGKSTILKSFSRNLKPKKGCVYLDGEIIREIDTRALARKLAVLPQIHTVTDDVTVRDLVSYGRFPHTGPTSRLKPTDFEAIEKAIAMTKLETIQHREIVTLSGGERQRAWIAMALAQEPEILLLDEPTTFLDINHQFELLELIRKLNSEINLTIVMVLHDLNQAARYSNRLIVLKEGTIFREGPPAAIITDEILAEVFSIRARIFHDPEYGCPYFLPLESRNG